MRKKLASRTTLLRRLAGSGCGAGAKTLRTAALFLVCATAGYYAPVWCRSAHTRLIDRVLKDALRVVTSCLRPTPTDYLPILSGIRTAELCRLGATLSLPTRGTLNLDRILHDQLVGLTDLSQERLKSRCLFVPAPWKQLHNLSKLGIRSVQWRNINGAQSIPNANLYSMFSFPGPVLRPLEWTCSEYLGSSSIACGLALGVCTSPCTNEVLLLRRIANVLPMIKLQTTLSQRAPYIGHLEGWLVRRLWMTILNAGLIQP